MSTVINESALGGAARQAPRAGRVAAVMAEHEQAEHKQKETVSR